MLLLQIEGAVDHVMMETVTPCRRRRGEEKETCFGGDIRFPWQKGYGRGRRRISSKSRERELLDRSSLPSKNNGIQECEGQLALYQFDEEASVDQAIECL